MSTKKIKKEQQTSGRQRNPVKQEVHGIAGAEPPLDDPCRGLEPGSDYPKAVAGWWRLTVSGSA
jgi:hypothetical protein